eukprot:g15103.t1
MSKMTLTRRIRSPEDIQIGDYVVKTHRRYQLVPCDLSRPLDGEVVEPIILYGWPYDAGEPLKVLAVCLPFVMTKTAYGSREAIDTRQDVLMKVSKSYGKSARPKPDKKKKKGKGKKRKKRKNK